MLGCCQQPTNSPASGASRRAGQIGAVNAPTWRAAQARQQGTPARMPTRITVRYPNEGGLLTGFAVSVSVCKKNLEICPPPPLPRTGLEAHTPSAGHGAATDNVDGDGVLLNRRQPAAFTAECGTRVATW